MTDAGVFIMQTSIPRALLRPVTMFAAARAATFTMPLRLLIVLVAQPLAHRDPVGGTS